MAQQQPVKLGHVPAPFMGPRDLDAWNISLFPRDLLQVFKPMSPVQLVSHAPTIKDHPTFKDWVSVGQSVFNMKIHPRYKQPLLNILVAADIVILGSEYPEALIYGNQVITCDVFIRCLEKAGVDTVRVQGYGMKMAIQFPYDGPNLGSLDHPMSNLNTFDLACNYNGGSITLVTNRHDGIPGLTQYPILTPVGQGYGGVQMPVHYGGQAYQVKIYPCIVHQIKAQAGNHMLTKPKQVQTCKRRRATLMGHLNQMEKLRGSQLGGLRVEATITSPTLHLAVQTIAKTPILNLGEYIRPTSELMQAYKIRCLRVSKDDYIGNLRTLLAKADEQEVFLGRDTSPAHPDSQQIIVDLFNALGWHTGRFQPTAWNDPAAWWLHSPGAAPVITSSDVQQNVEAEERRQPSKALLKRRLRGMEALRSFYDQVKGKLDCPRCKKRAPALFNQGGRRQFRLQCRGCKVRFNQDQAREYFGQLIDQGHLVISDLDIALEEVQSEQPQEVEAAVEDVTTEDDDTDMPDLRSGSDSSGEDQAPVHPLHGPRRQSMRLRQQAAPEAEVFDHGTDAVVVLPALSTSPSPEPTVAPGTFDDARIQAILDELELDLAAEAAERIKAHARSRLPSATPPRSSVVQDQTTSRAPSVAPARRRSPAVMPSSQPLHSKPNLQPVKGITIYAAVLRNLYGLKVSNVIGKDGNCMFRAMAYHLTGSQGLHMEVRIRAINWLQRNPAILLGFAAQGEGHFSAASYLSNMARPGEWGDEIMLMAIAQAYNASIMVYSGRDPTTSDSNATIYPHNAPGPHYGLFHLIKSQHYELLFP